MKAIIGLDRRTRRGLVAATLAVGCFGWLAAVPAHAVGLVYVEADDGFDTGSPNLSPLSAVNSENTTPTVVDNLWGYRALGSGAPGLPVIFESSTTGNPGAEDSPQLTMTLTTANGLVSGASYDVYVAYWSATGQNWTIQGGLPGGTWRSYSTAPGR